ncbi:protein KASH5 isoform 2-T2 [Morphnus guianensis]
MAAEGPPAPLPRTPGTAAPPEEAALPAVEAETPQDPLRSGYRPAAHLLPLASDVRDRGFRGHRSLHNLSRSPPPAAQDSAATRQGKSCCSEEFVLNYTFTICDPEQTGSEGPGLVQGGATAPDTASRCFRRLDLRLTQLHQGRGCRKIPPAHSLPPPGEGEGLRGPKAASTPNPPGPFPVPPRLLLLGSAHGAGHRPRVREGVAPQPDTPPCAAGMVLAWRVVEYLQAVTGQSSEEGQLRALHRMLDPEAAGAALDLPTFHAIMREWIALCQQGSVPGDQGQKAVPRVLAGATDSSHLSRGSRLAEEWDVAAGDLGLVLAAGEGRTALAAAQLEGDGGNTDIMSPTEATGLRRRAEQLAAQNAKLQWDAKLAEELNAHMAEETAQLKAQLRCSRQALEQARAAAEELEDLKAVAKGLEEENSELRQQARQLVRGPASSLPLSPQLPPRCQASTRGSSSGPCVFPPQEKEQRCLCSQANDLQEEVRTPLGAMGKGACPGSTGVVVSASPFCPKQNQRLLAEGHGLRQRIQALSAEMADLEAQLSRCTALLSSRDVALAQAGLRVEELTVALEEYDRAVQELRLETMRLRDQLGRMQDAWAMRLWCPLGEADIPAQPLSAEIAATCRTGEAEEDAGTAAPGALAGDGEEPAEPQQCPGPSESRPPPTLLPLPPPPALLALLLLLALLCLLPRHGLGLPSGVAAWPQLQLRYQRPPPL